MSTDSTLADFPKELSSGRFIVGTKLVERPSCVVFKGIDKQLGDRAVAIKIFIDRPNKNKEWIDAFEREVALLRNASHRALVPIIAGGVEGDWFYLVMELIDGMTLREYLKGLDAPLDIKVAIDIISKVALATKEIHEKNSFHGHMDSRSVMFKGKEPRLAGYYPHVLSEIHKSQTSTGRLLVDPGYIAPEQISSTEKVDGRADIYAIGVLLYEMLTLKKPFSSENPMQMAMLRMTSEPQSPQKLNSQIPSLVDGAIIKALARNPKDRFLNIADFIDALTGGKQEAKNPLFEAMGKEPERISGTETIAVSMSTDAIKGILREHERKSRQEKDFKIKTETVPKEQALSEPLAVDSTMIGMRVDKIFKATVVIVSEKSFGTKFDLNEKQTVIGSNSACEILLSGKNIAAHAAIIVGRNSNYYVAPLSADVNLRINGKAIDISEEHLLIRGDVIECAEYQLRYVAPGEVFTLQKDVADRIIDKPKSKLPKYLGISAFVALVISGFLFYSYKGNLFLAQNSQKKSQETRKLAKKELVDKLRKEGDDFFKAGILIEPVEANARKRFEQIIELDSDDTYAKRRISEIEERVRLLGQQADKKKLATERVSKLLQDAEQYFKAGKYIAPLGANAKEIYEEVIKLDSENQVAKNKLAEINNILGDFVAKINDLLTLAKEKIEKKQYVSPEGDNAKELIEQIMGIDPKNADAHKLLIEIAARSIIEGDLAKSKLNAGGMKQSYLTAQAIGVDPEYIKNKMQGADIISRSKSSVVIVDTGAAKTLDSNEKPNSSYLDLAEVNQRISVLKLQEDVQGGGGSTKSQFFEVKSVNKK